MLTVVEGPAAGEELAAGLDKIVREAARRMLAAVLEAEVEVYVAASAGKRDEAGRRLVVRNGYARPRQATTVAEAVQVSAPRVDDRRVAEMSGRRRRFRSAMSSASTTAGTLWHEQSVTDTYVRSLVQVDMRVASDLTDRCVQPICETFSA